MVKSCLASGMRNPTRGCLTEPVDLTENPVRDESDAGPQDGVLPKPIRFGVQAQHPGRALRHCEMLMREGCLQWNFDPPRTVSTLVPMLLPTEQV